MSHRTSKKSGKCKTAPKWRGVRGYDWQGNFHAYYVVRGESQDAREVQFRSRVFMLANEAEETADHINKDKTPLRSIKNDQRWPHEVRRVVPLTSRVKPQHLSIIDAALVKGKQGASLSANEFYALLESKYLKITKEGKARLECGTCQGDKRVIKATGNPNHPLGAIKCRDCAGTGERFPLLANTK